MLGAAVLLTLGAAGLQATPLIIVQPTNATAFVGDANASFKVQATGDATLTYQWQMRPGNSGSFSDISGNTSATLSLSNPATTSNGYQYRCVLTGTGASAGTLTSAAAQLNVYVVPALTPSVTLSSSLIAANSSNDITIHINGVAAGNPVCIQRFLDTNGNASPDLGEPLVQSVLVTDGGVNAIGGVTNTNVPRDEDGAANGSITTHFSLPSSAELGCTAGSYLIYVSSPSGLFRPIITPFTITQPTYGQSISGQVLAGATPVPFAVVVLINNAGNGGYAASTVANASGNYTINAPVGNYMVLAIQPGYVGQMGALAMSLAAGQALTGQNPGLAAATCTISGQVQDASTTSTLNGIQLMFSSNGKYFSLASSDSSGNYVVSALPDSWKGQPSDLSLAALGYTSSSSKTSVTTTSGNVASQTLQCSAATALLSGIVKNAAAALMPGVTLDANMSNGNNSNLSSQATTDANGNFTFGVSAGTWNVQLNSNYVATNNLIGTSLQQAVTNGQGISGLAIQSATATGTISGYVHDANGAGVSTNVTVTATLNGANYVCYANTDSSGNYSFPVINGLWNVNISQSGYNSQSVQVSGSVVVNFMGLSAFQQWQQTYFSSPQLGNAGISGMAAKVVSGAGYANEIAYALGVDPRAAKTNDLPTLSKATVASLSYQTLGFNRNLAAADLTYQVQSSPDLANWTPLSTYSAGAWSPSNIVSETTTRNANPQQVLVRDSVPLGSSGKRFLRLVVIHP